MSRDAQRYRKTYSYYRVQPRTELLEVIVDEALDWKNSVRTASTTSHALTGAGTTLSIGGVTVVDEDRVLLKNQATASQNGIYYFEVAGGNYVLTRASDARTGTLSCGAATFVEEGTNAGKIYILTTTNPITIDSTSLTWTEFSSGGGIAAIPFNEGFLTQWDGFGQFPSVPGTSTLSNSFIRNFNNEIGRYSKNEHHFQDTSGNNLFAVLSRVSGEGRVGINTGAPDCPLHVIIPSGDASTKEAFRIRNASGTEGAGLQINLLAGNYSTPTFRITHRWPSTVEGHYTFFGISKPTPSPFVPEIVERFRMYSSGSVEVSGSFQARLDPEIINKPIVSVQKSDGSEVMWISSSAGSHPVGTDVFMWVSGSRTTDSTGADKVVFGGDVRISGSLSVGTGSVLLTSNDVQFGSSGMRIQKSGNDMKFFDLNNVGGVTLSDLVSGGGGGGGNTQFARLRYGPSIINGGAYVATDIIWSYDPDGTAGIQVYNGSPDITIVNAGTYDVSFRGQVNITAGVAPWQLWVWLEVDSGAGRVNVPDSGTYEIYNNVFQRGSMGFRRLVKFNAGDILYVCFRASQAGTYFDQVLNSPYPASPAVELNIVSVSI